MLFGAGKIGVKEVVVGIVAVFDGHNGADASDMASKLLLEYFVLHTYFLLDATFSKKSAGRFLDKREYDVVFRVLNWDERTTRCMTLILESDIVFKNTYMSILL